MYNVLLVDDEYLELELLEKHVPWGELGFKVIDTAKNGREALDVFERLSPDILITDVKMPFVDGIALANKVYQSYPETRIIFLSGYNQFDYLKAAFHVEAVDYLLKPVDLEELQALMSVVKNKCDQEYNKKSNDLSVMMEQVHELLSSDSLEAWDNKSNELRILLNQFFQANVQNTDYYLALITIDELAYITKYNDTIIFTINDFRMLFTQLNEDLHAITYPIKDGVYILISYKNPWDIVHSWKNGNKNLQDYITLCYPEEPISVAQFHTKYHRLCELRDWYVHHKGIGQIKSIGEIEQILTDWKAKPCKDITMPDKGLLIQAITQGDTDTIGEWLTSFFAAAEEDNIYNHTFELLDYIYTVLVSPNKTLTKYLDDKPKMFKKLSYIESIHLLKDVTQSQILKIMNEIITTENADFCLLMIKKVQRYVESHYQEAFAVEALSESLNYSPNYIRSIFKKYTGETLLEYITKLRMERALQLLLDSTVRICNISYKVGYSNPSYFCSQFNKKFGMTPQQYRSKIQQ